MKHLLKSVVTFSVLCFLIQFSEAIAGKISGYIFDNVTRKPIPDANVIVSNTNFGAASKDGGFYFVDNIPQGTYDVSVRVIGYEIATKSGVAVTDQTSLNFHLTPKVIELDPILVTATLSDHLQSQVSVASEVLTLPRLNTKNAATVGEAIQSVGSVYFNSYDGMAGPQIASIRGSNADQVVVLLDGLRLNTAQGGGVDLNLVPVSVLERVEVVRGGHSALLGSDAIGGAVQLISKETIDPGGFSYSVNSTLGSFGTRNLNLSGSHRIGMVATFLNYSRVQSDGDFTFKMPATDEQATRINNDYEGNNFFLKSKIDFSEKHQLQAIFHNLLAKKGNAGSVNISPWTNEPMITPHARANVDRKLIAVKSENQLANRFRLEGDVFYQSYDYHYQDPDGWSPTSDKHDNSAMGLKLQAQFLASRHLNLIAGTELRQDRLGSTKFEVDHRNIQSLYALAEVNFPIRILSLPMQWTTIPAMRWDNYSDVDAQASPKLGLLISSGEIISLGWRGNIGKSFRVPTFDDLYWPDEGWGRGNPSVKPETSTNFDAGLTFSRKVNSIFQGEVTYFNNNVNDLISWGADPSGIWMPLNVGRAIIQGIETGIKYRLPQNVAYLEVFHTWLKAIDETPNGAAKGKRLIYRPGSKLDISLGSNFKGLTLNLNYRLVSKRYTLADNSQSLPAYDLLDGNIGYSMPIAGFTIDTKFQVSNILDKSLCLIDGYPSPGREFRLSFGVSY